MITDVICNWKMTSCMALDGVTSFFRLKDVTNTCKRMRHGLSIGGSSSVYGKTQGLNFSNYYYITKKKDRFSLA